MRRLDEDQSISNSMMKTARITPFSMWPPMKMDCGLEAYIIA